MKTAPTDGPSTLRALRLARGESVRALGHRVQLSGATISRIERGINRPSLPALRRLAKALGVRDVGWLLDQVLGNDERGRS